MTTQDQLITLIKKFSKTINFEINTSTNINDLKFDSLDLLEFQMDIDNYFGIELSIEDFLRCHNIGDIVRLVEQSRANK